MSINARTHKDVDGVDVLGIGLYWDDLEVGYKFRTLGRSITETDIAVCCGISGMVEEIFTNMEYIKDHSMIGSRPAPAALTLAVAEGLVMQAAIQRTGMGFLEADLKMLKPTTAGDTLHVDVEVIEKRETKKPGRGLVRTFNQIINQRGEVVATYNPLRMMRCRPTE